MQASISIEAQQETVSDNNIVYGLYLDNAANLSTLILKICFRGDIHFEGMLSLADNNCFDIVSEQWNGSTDSFSLYAYLGRTGDKTGYSSSTRVKIADISVLINNDAKGAVFADITQAQCAGIESVDLSAVKGTATVSGASAVFYISDFHISEYKNGNIYITSSCEQSATVILAEYNHN